MIIINITIIIIIIIVTTIIIVITIPIESRFQFDKIDKLLILILIRRISKANKIVWININRQKN